MICSPLTTQIVDFGTKNSNPRNQKITKITPHHMGGVTNNAAGVAAWHKNAGVSTNYYIAGDQIVAGVSEDRRTWASSSPANDHAAITIEVANSTTQTEWKVSDASYRSLVRLCADICKRYGIRPHYDGTKNGTITIHKQFAGTICPGPYLENLIKSHQFEADILAEMGQPKPQPTAIPPVPFLAKVKHQGRIFRAPAAGSEAGTLRTGIYTITEISGSFGKLKSGAGWIYLGDPKQTEVFRREVEA